MERNSMDEFNKCRIIVKVIVVVPVVVVKKKRWLLSWALHCYAIVIKGKLPWLDDIMLVMRDGKWEINFGMERYGNVPSLDNLPPIFHLFLYGIGNNILRFLVRTYYLYNL